MEELWSDDDERQLHACTQAAEDGDLLKALLAIENADSRTAEWVEQTLIDWGDRVYQQLDGETPAEQYHVIRRVLVEELNLRGAVDDYRHPDNSVLSRVMRRRCGLPILLAVIWIMIGNEAGIEVDGIGMPAHFIARVGGSEGLLVDPFDRGVRLSPVDCRRILERVAGNTVVWRDEYLNPSATWQIVGRVLRNLVSSYARTDNSRLLYRSVRFCSGVCSDNPQLFLGLARLSEAYGALQTALSQYQELVDRFPGESTADIADERIRELKSSRRWVN